MKLKGMEIINLISKKYGIEFETLFSTLGKMHNYRAYFEDYKSKLDITHRVDKGKCTLTYTQDFNVETKPFTVTLHYENVNCSKDLDMFFKAVDQIVEIK